MDESTKGILQAFLVTGANGQKRREIKFSKAINGCRNPDGSRLTPEQGLLFAILLQAIKDLLDLYNLRRDWISQGIDVETLQICEISRRCQISIGMGLKAGQIIESGRHAKAFFNCEDLREKRRIGEVRYKFRRGTTTKIIELFDYLTICDELGIDARRLRNRLAILLND